MAARIAPPSPPPTDGVIALRPFRAEDAPAVAAACRDPEVGRWIPIVPVPYTEADARAFILLTLSAWADGNGFEFAIVDAETDEYLGSVGIQPGSNARRRAIGYLVRPDRRNRGVATRALRLAVRWAFANLEVERIALWTLPGNSASQRVAEKAGFRYEGMIRNWESGRDGRPIDVVMFSMTPDDFAEAEAQAAEAGAHAGEAVGSAEGARSAEVDGQRAEPPINCFPPELRATGSRSAAFVDLLGLEELEPGSLRRVTIADRDLLVAWTPDGIVVTEDRCPHMSAPLSIGQLDGCVVACPLHEGRFDLSTGETVQMPTTGGLDADGIYHSPWSPSGAAPKPEPPSKKLEARRLTRVHRLTYYQARIREGRLEAQVPLGPV